MRIGVISDTHITAEEWCRLSKPLLDALKGVAMIIHAGDIADMEVIEQLKGICKDVRAVWGNMDPYEVRKALPEKEVITVSKYKIGLTHGWGHPDKLVDAVTEAFRGEDIDIFIFGHSHKALNKRINNKLYFNPGSPTDKIFADSNTYGIIEVNDSIKATIVEL